MSSLSRHSLELISILTKAIMALLLCASFGLNAQVYDDDEDAGGKPKIRGQRDLSTNEEQAITIDMMDVEVEDKDDLLYPVGFTMRLYPGDHYTFSDRTVTPSKDFAGTLTVPITVNDGERDSEKFNLKITVKNINDAPIIKSQAQSIATMAGVAVTLQLSYLNVDDPDDDYPSDFNLKVQNGSNYTVSGKSVTPNEDYVGSLSVGVLVNDGAADSNPFDFVVQVSARSNKPIITNQTPVIIQEDQTFTIELSHLVVDDPQNTYPQGFSLQVGAGPNFTVNGATVVPAANYHGDLVVPVTVTRGQEQSDVFDFRITVRSVNDAPVLTLADTSAIRVRYGD
ncbi:MAG TPA: Ig-like domain-containing protein, partial [Chryseosolibacter sp.]|nr:Ig-like domain-containing protein [Chryseosolibacter sp.]